MIELYFVVEGETEEEVIKTLIRPHLNERGVSVYDPICVGGNRWGRFRRDIDNLFKAQRPEVWVTTMVDLYAIGDDFPSARNGNTFPTPTPSCSPSRLR